MESNQSYSRARAGKPKKESMLSKAERMHPHETMFIGAMIGIVLVFIGIEAIFLFNVWGKGNGEGSIFVPKAFFVSTLILFISSRVIAHVETVYKEGEVHELLRKLNLTLALGLAYCAMQIIGWAELYYQSVYLSGLPAGAALYVLSGVHIAHIVVGMLFLGITCLKLSKKANDPVDLLIYETSPYERIRVRMLNLYWQVMDVIWLLIFASFVLVF